jgi:DNA-binding beta-propeller fold protein YncE
VIDRVSTNITYFAGTGEYGFAGDGGLSTKAQLYKPLGGAYDPFYNQYYFADGSNRIRVIDLNTEVINTFAGADSSGGYSGDGGLATSALLNNPRIIRIDLVNNLGNFAIYFSYMIAYIADASNCVVRVVNRTSGVISTVAGIGSSCEVYGDDNVTATASPLNYPMDMAIDSVRNLGMVVSL